jgi:hypothetical protein
MENQESVCGLLGYVQSYETNNNEHSVPALGLLSAKTIYQRQGTIETYL